MNKSIVYLLLILLICHQDEALAQSYKLKSPDSSIVITIEDKTIGNAVISYGVAYGREEVFKNSTIQPVISGDNQNQWILKDSIRECYNNTWNPVYGESNTIINRYNSLRLKFNNLKNSNSLEIVFRAYNEGFAYRYLINSESSEKKILKSEQSIFEFLSNPSTWVTTRAQGEYQKKFLNELTADEVMERPLTLKISDSLYASMGEAALTDFARMKFRKKEINSLQSDLSGPVQFGRTLESPWRFVLLANSEMQLLGNNYLILNLNDPNRIKDTSWIKPGKVIRSALSTEAAKTTIDFAAENGLQYVLFDSGWYGKETDPKSDASTDTVDPDRAEGSFDIKEIIRYGNEKSISVILYVNRRVLETQMDVIFPLYQKWGVKGVKFGFVQVGSQKWTKWLHRAVEKAAANKLMVDIHDEYRPTGFSRTFPNLMTQEGIRGDEEKPGVDQTLITIFTRQIAGAGDQTNTYFHPNVAKMGTHGIQLAKTICIYSPWQFLFWYDRPPNKNSTYEEGTIQPVPEMEFFKELPVVWDETRILEGEIGRYVSIARRKGDMWFVGIINGHQERDAKIDFEFLEKNTRYQAKLFKDDPEASTITKISKTVSEYSSESEVDYHLKETSGMVIQLTPISGK